MKCELKLVKKYHIFLIPPGRDGSLPVKKGHPLQVIMLNEISQLEKDKYCMTSHMCEI